MPRASWPCVSEAGQARRRSTVAGGEADAVVALGRLVGQGLPAVLVTVVAVEGNPPSHPGAKLVFSGDRVVVGTLGCSEFDTAGAALAAELASAAVGHAGSCRPGARSGSPAALRRRAVFGHGGQQVLDMFAERFEPSPGAIVAGDNPVGRSVAERAGLIGTRHGSWTSCVPTVYRPSAWRICVPRVAWTLALVHPRRSDSRSLRRCWLSSAAAQAAASARRLGGHLPSGLARGCRAPQRPQ